MRTSEQYMKIILRFVAVASILSTITILAVACSSHCSSNDGIGCVGCGGKCVPGESCEEGRCVPHGGLQLVATEGTTEGGEGALGVSGLTDGSFLITGFYSSQVTFDVGGPNETTLSNPSCNNFNGSSGFLARFRSDGTLDWVANIIDDKCGMGTGLSAGNGGFAFVTGHIATDENNRTFLVSKFKLDGSREWIRTASSPTNLGSSQGTSVCSLPDGSTLATGNFSGTVVFGLGEPNEETLESPNDDQGNSTTEVFLARFDLDGALSWVKTAGSRNGSTNPSILVDLGIGVSPTADGSIIVSGTVLQGATFGLGEPRETTLPEAGAFLARFESDGSLRWARYVCNCSIWNPSVLIDDSLVVTGEYKEVVTLGSGEAHETTLQPSAGIDGRALFLAKYDGDGHLIWAHSAHGAKSNMSNGSSVGGGPGFISDAGSLFVIGTVFVAGLFGEKEWNETTVYSLPTGSAYIAKYNGSGRLSWAKSLSNEILKGPIVANGITAFPDDSSVIVGQSNSDILIIRLEP